MKAKQCELKNYWDDGVTIESKYFASMSEARRFAKREGYVNYKIEKKE